MTLHPVAVATAVDLVDTAIVGKLTTLVAAARAAGLVSVLKGRGPFTVLAPSDDAFARLPAGTLESLLDEENKETLQGLLKHHVLSGTVLAADAVKLHSVRMLSGQDLDIVSHNGRVTIGGATITATDLVANNGVIHVIDTVLFPK